MFGINGGELLVIILVAILVIGPERMPDYAAQLREWVIKGRDLVTQNKDALKRDIGDDVDWQKLDPRQYDPRRIVREALAEPPATPPAASAPPAAAAPFDADAT